MGLNYERRDRLEDLKFLKWQTAYAVGLRDYSMSKADEQEVYWHVNRRLDEVQEYLDSFYGGR